MVAPRFIHRDTHMLHLHSTLLDGTMCCLFAYGQTGSGKTHTLFGNILDKDGDVDSALTDAAAPASAPAPARAPALPAPPPRTRTGLPLGWKAFKNADNNRMYYHRAATGRVQWTKPRYTNDELPAGWQESFDSAGKLFYYNTVTNRSQWASPMPPPAPPAPAPPLPPVATAAPRRDPRERLRTLLQHMPAGWGIIPRVALEVLAQVTGSTETKKWWVRRAMSISFFEVYQVLPHCPLTRLVIHTHTRAQHHCTCAPTGRCHQPAAPHWATLSEATQGPVC